MANNKDFKVKNGIKPVSYVEKVGEVNTIDNSTGPVGEQSVDLYTGNAGTNEINNGLNMAVDGGMVWIKQRTNENVSSGLPSEHIVMDSERGAGYFLATNSTRAQQDASTAGFSFDSDGFTVKQYTINPGDPYEANYNGVEYVMWSWKKKAGAFDIVTHVGDANTSQTINHNLGVVPEMMIVKRYDNTEGWQVYHKDLGATKNLELNTTAIPITATNRWNDTAPTSTQFTVGNHNGVNANASNYVTYLFASETGKSKVGSYTGTGSININLGWKPHFVMIKRTDVVGSWFIFDNKRGVGASSRPLWAESEHAETDIGVTDWIEFTSTGFSSAQATLASGDFIYYAVREPVEDIKETLDLFTGSVFEITPTSDITISANNPAVSGTVSSATLLLDGGVVNAWDISTAVYSNQNFSFSSQDTAMRTGFFKPDGTKMYMGGSSSNTLYEYNLSTAWDVSTASYASKSFSISSQETSVSGLFFKTDGTKMYMCGKSSDAVNEYNLSTAWDISTATYNQNFSVSSQDTNPSGLFFRSDGLKMYVAGASGDDVNEYTLSTAWDVSTASYVQTFGFSSQDTDVGGIFFKPDGTKMFHLGDQNNNVYEYTLTTAWDVSTASYTQSFSVATEEIYPKAISFKSDGSKMFVFGEQGNDVSEYSLGASATITYDTTLQWVGGTAPTSPVIGETDVISLETKDGGTTYQAKLLIDGAK